MTSRNIMFAKVNYAA